MYRMPSRCCARKVLTSDRPVVPAHQDLRVLVLQGPRDGVRPLHGVAWKRAPNRVDVVQAHVAVVGDVQRPVLRDVAVHPRGRFARGVHELEVDAVDRQAPPLRANNVGGLDEGDLATLDRLAETGIDNPGRARCEVLAVHVAVA